MNPFTGMRYLYRIRLIKCSRNFSIKTDYALEHQACYPLKKLSDHDFAGNEVYVWNFVLNSQYNRPLHWYQLLTEPKTA